MDGSYHAKNGAKDKPFAPSSKNGGDTQLGVNNLTHYHYLTFLILLIIVA